MHGRICDSVKTAPEIRNGDELHQEDHGDYYANGARVVRAAVHRDSLVYFGMITFLTRAFMKQLTFRSCHAAAASVEAARQS